MLFLKNYNLLVSFIVSERVFVDFEGFGFFVLLVGVDEFFFRMFLIENGLVFIME